MLYEKKNKNKPISQHISASQLSLWDLSSTCSQSSVGKLLNSPGRYFSNADKFWWSSLRNLHLPTTLLLAPPASLHPCPPVPHLGWCCCCLSHFDWFRQLLLAPVSPSSLYFCYCSLRSKEPFLSATLYPGGFRDTLLVKRPKAFSSGAVWSRYTGPVIVFDDPYCRHFDTVF